MKNLKKKLAGFLIFAMVLGIMAPGMTVQAADEPKKKINAEIDYVNKEIHITLSDSISGSAIYFADTKGTIDPAKEKTTTLTEEQVDALKVKVWEDVPAETVTQASIDVSWVKEKTPTKIVFRVGKGDDALYYALETPKQTEKLKVGMTNVTGSATIGRATVPLTSDEYTVGTEDEGYLFFYGSDNKPVSVSSIQWKKGGSGTWEKADSGKLEKDLPKFKAKGTTLYFRKVEDDNWATAEVKFAYKKQAKEPKVTINESAYTVKFPKGAQYIVVGKENVQDDTLEWQSADNKTLNILKVGNPDDYLKIVDATTTTAITMEDLDLANGGLELWVRTAGTAKAIPSKIAKIDLNLVSPSSVTVVATGAAASGTKTGLYAQYKTYDKTTNPTVELSNYETEYTYEYAVSNKSDASDVTKWSKLAVAKTVGTPKVAKIANKALSGKTYLVVRPAGVKKADLAGKVTAVTLASIYAPTPSVKAIPTVTVKQHNTTGAAVTGFTVKAVTANAVYAVTGTAVSGTGIVVTVSIELEGLTKATTTFTVEAQNGLAVKALNGGKAKDSKVEVEVTVPAGANDKTAAIIKIEGLELKLNLDIAAAK